MFTYNYAELFKADSIGAMVSLAILGVAAFFILSGIFFGLKRGFSKSVVRLLTVAVAAVGAFFICSYAYKWAEGFIDGKSLEEILRLIVPNYDTALGEKPRSIIASIDSTAAYDLAKLVVALIAMPLLFVLVFFVAKAVLFIVYLILSAILGKTSYRKGFFSRIFGMAVGAVQGALIAAIVLLPVAGYSGIAAEFKSTLPESDPAAEPTVAQKAYTEVLDKVIENPVLGLVGKFGTPVFKSLVTVDTGAGAVDMSAEAVSIADITFNVIELKGANFKELTEADRQKIIAVRDKLNADAYLNDVLSGVLRSVSNAVNNGALNIPAPDPFGSLFKESISVFSTSTKDNFKDDLGTMLNVYFILSDHKIITVMGGGASEEVLNALVMTDADGNTAVSLIIDEFEKNSRMSFMISSISKLSVSIMAGSLGLDEEAEQVYVELKSDLKGALELNSADFETEEEYKVAVESKVDEALKNQGITLKEEELSGIADHIAENHYDTSEISDADIDNAILSYYDAYLKSLENGEAPVLPEDIPGGIPEGIPGGIPEGTPEGVPEGAI